METISLTDTQTDTREILCGFYELDAQGKILYARLNHDGKFERADDSVIGHDFFAEIFTCRNIDALQHRFQAFVTGKLTTENFTFNGNFSDRMIPFRVMLVRVAENKDGGARRNLY